MRCRQGREWMFQRAPGTSFRVVAEAVSVFSMKFPKGLFNGLVFLFLLQSAVFLQAQESKSVQAKHCLWKVPGKTNAVYLFGSIHFLKKDFYPLPEPIEKAYERSGTVVFEID